MNQLHVLLRIEMTRLLAAALGCIALSAHAGDYRQYTEVSAQGYLGQFVRDSDGGNYSTSAPGYPGYAPIQSFAIGAGAVLPTGNAIGRSSIDLASGAFRLFASGETNPNLCCGQGVWATFAKLEYRDVISIVGDISGVQSGSITVHLEGVMSAPDLASHRATAGIGLNTGSSIPGGGGFGGRSFQTSGCASATCEEVSGAFSSTFIVPFLVSANSRDVSLVLNVDAFAQGLNSFADLQNTATIAIQLPVGLTFISNSLVLLTSPIPEPSSVALFIFGLLLFGCRSLCLHSAPRGAA